MGSVDEALEAISRRDFLPKNMQGRADVDAPLPIGFGQTNSQPSTVHAMLEWLDLQPGGAVLDVGSGSGWTTALIAHVVGHEGQVYAVEKVPELVQFGADNCRHAGIANAQFFEAGRSFGLPEHAPYDRILVSASAIDLPQELLDQLKVGGRLVIPVRSSIYVADKTDTDTYDTAEHPGFVFVPLV